MNREQVVSESFDLLAKVLEEAYVHLQTKPGDLEEAFVYRHARNISQLGQDVRLLESHDQSDSCPIIVRAMLESLFKLVAATKTTGAAVEIVLSEINQEVHLMERWIQIVDGDCGNLTETVQQLSSLADGLRTQHNIQTNRGWNAFECAKAADLGTIYRQYYFLFSKHIHATTSGIIAQEKEIARDCVLEAVIFIVLCAIGSVVQVVETETPQSHVDKTAKLMDLALAFMNKSRECAR